MVTRNHALKSAFLIWHKTVLPLNLVDVFSLKLLIFKISEIEYFLKYIAVQ